ncbi:glycosyltransferase family 2 protein [Pedobacter metabolipauper]|uniref:Glycosyltransferase involved in cell wall biosynthesis n=1 Tax=Pedobacter metabolipauper TaxID=425513 RepID=A0A4R6SVJ1_9SPHI|nr:glycosyltransferase family 2 protein [Pedobacter metabolipauper]TDQ09366.1 glycosyltransferase involved in cell wall biosynthesis [Pedobacter metabolipauper]
MSNQALVSIALCVYNGEQFLKEQLDSILNQNYQNIEIIIVDDCSADQSRTILNTYKEKYSIIKLYFNTANLGYVRNFEKAITLATGKYIALSDQDDIWHPEKISKQVAEIGDHMLIYHDSQYMDHEGKDLDLKMSDVFNLYEGNSPLPFLLKNCVSGHTIMFNRILLEHALPFNADFFHDWWLAFVASNAGSIKLVPQTLVRYRQHTENTIDMLDLRKINEPQEDLYNPLVTDKAWIGHCSTYSGPYADYAYGIYKLITSKLNFFNKIKLYILLYKNRKLLFAINKNSGKEKAAMLKKFVFALPNNPV